MISDRDLLGKTRLRNDRKAKIKISKIKNTGTSLAVLDVLKHWELGCEFRSVHDDLSKFKQPCRMSAGLKISRSSIKPNIFSLIQFCVYYNASPTVTDVGCSLLWCQERLNGFPYEKSVRRNCFRL